MKRTIIFIFFVILVGITLVVFPIFGVFAEDDNIMSTSDAAQMINIAETNADCSDSFDNSLHLQVLLGKGVTEMSLRDYLIGVLSAEMPSTFPPEALKAQAIAARTFALRQAETGKHLSADVCISSECCQGWNTGRNEATAQAVEETDGLVITYENQLIDATYFSCCGSRTEAALAVWGGDIPYLQSVESPGENEAPRYTDEVVLDVSYFAQTLRNKYPLMVLEGSPETWFGKITYTKGGGIDTVTIGGIAVDGTSLRKLFSLCSTDIAFQTNEDRIIITTYGFGHRVGMSQYGAKVMAENNCNFSEILKHYYQNVEIQRLYLEKTPLPTSEEA